MTEKKLWKSLKLKDERIVSGYDNSPWTIGEWRTVCAPTEECKGLNACENLVDAINYVAPDIIAEVEVAGGRVKGDDKFTCERMRILRAWKWEKQDSVALAIYAARLCLHNFEDKYPNDDRPRKAIEAAEAYLSDPTEMNRSAARSALGSAAWSAESAAESAWSAAESAAWSAESAAESAWSAESAAKSASESAAESAESAAESAWSAAESAWSAAWSAAKKKIHSWIVKHLDEMTELRQEHQKEREQR